MRVIADRSKSCWRWSALLRLRVTTKPWLELNSFPWNFNVSEIGEKWGLCCPRNSRHRPTVKESMPFQWVFVCVSKLLQIQTFSKSITSHVSPVSNPKQRILKLMPVACDEMTSVEKHKSPEPNAANIKGSESWAVKVKLSPNPSSSFLDNTYIYINLHVCIRIHFP